jgi:hypothetical protein
MNLNQEVVPEKTETDDGEPLAAGRRSAATSSSQPRSPGEHFVTDWATHHAPVDAR